MIQRIVAGERELYHELIRPYERAVYVTLLSMLKNEADAEDAAQEAILKAYRALKSFREEAKFSTWLLAIAMNEGRGRLRKQSAAHLESLDEEREGEEGSVTPAQLTDWREVPLEALERKELRIMGKVGFEELSLKL
jgi:RNA polymerase sigma-70 factor, ECF subfamily